MNSYRIARVVTSTINAMARPTGLTFTPELRLRTFAKAQDVDGLAVHVIPLPPDLEVVDRNGDVLADHNVMVLVFDRMPSGTDPDSSTAYDWSEARTGLIDDIIDLNWNSITVDGESVGLSEVDAAAVTFDTADTDSLFGRAIVLRFSH